MNILANTMRLPVLLSILAALLCHPEPGNAAVPEAINFQGIARQPDGTPISNQAVKLRATIRRTSVSGAISYQETLNASTTAGGQFSVKIGTGTVVQGNFATVDWATFLHFMQVELDPAGGNAFSDMGTQQLLSVPYAQHAGTSDAVSGTTGRVPFFDAPDSLASTSLYYSGGFFGFGDPTPTYTLDVAGTVRGQTAVRSDADVIAADDVLAGGDLSASANLSVAGNGSITGGLTVNGGKGVVYNASNGTNLKIYPFTTATFSAVLPGHGLSAEGSIVFGGAFTSPPRVFVGDIDVTGGTTGELYRVQLVLYGATILANGNASCKARLLNTSPNSVNYTITWNCVAIGN